VWASQLCKPWSVWNTTWVRTWVGLAFGTEFSPRNIPEHGHFLLEKVPGLVQKWFTFVAELNSLHSLQCVSQQRAWGPALGRFVMVTSPSADCHMAASWLPLCLLVGPLLSIAFLTSSPTLHSPPWPLTLPLPPPSPDFSHTPHFRNSVFSFAFFLPYLMWTCLRQNRFFCLHCWCSSSSW
jgi:hypothetical protein